MSVMNARLMVYVGCLLIVSRASALVTVPYLDITMRNFAFKGYTYDQRVLADKHIRLAPTKHIDLVQEFTVADTGSGDFEGYERTEMIVNTDGVGTTWVHASSTARFSWAETYDEGFERASMGLGISVHPIVPVTTDYHHDSYHSYAAHEKVDSWSRTSTGNPFGVPVSRNTYYRSDSDGSGTKDDPANWHLWGPFRYDEGEGSRLYNIDGLLYGGTTTDPYNPEIGGGLDIPRISIFHPHWLPVYSEFYMEYDYEIKDLNAVATPEPASLFTLAGFSALIVRRKKRS